MYIKRVCRNRGQFLSDTGLDNTKPPYFITGRHEEHAQSGNILEEHRQLSHDLPHREGSEGGEETAQGETELEGHPCSTPDIHQPKQQRAKPSAQALGLHATTPVFNADLSPRCFCNCSVY